VNSESFAGFFRKDEKVGTRNLLAIIPTVFCVNEVVTSLAALVPGSKPLIHMHGCCELKPSLNRTTRILCALVGNPNVGGCVIVSLGCEAIEGSDLLAAAERAGKPALLLNVQEEGGMRDCIDRRLADVRELKADLDRAERMACDVSHLVVGIKCGSSDATSGLAANPAAGVAADMLVERNGTVIFGETTEFIGAEHILAERCGTAEVRRHLLEIVERIERRAASAGVDMRGSQPTPGNIRGGLTTIEEKSLGAISKSGSQPIADVLEYAQPVEGRGLFAMDSPGKENEIMTGLAAAGANLIVFTTGGGAPQGFPLVPVIKVASNPAKCVSMKDHIDVDVSGLLQARYSVEEAGQRIFQVALEVASGRMTKAEELGYDRTIGFFDPTGASL
jgi:altronate dehydratase large subunit